MTIALRGKSVEPMNSLERLVQDALLRLTPRYRVVTQPVRFLLDEDEFSLSFKYKPDFEISNNLGNKLFIEVKSESSLTLPNMVNFVRIDQAIRRDENQGFLILVISESLQMTRFATRPEFQQLHIRYARNQSDVLNAIEKEFSNSFEQT